MIPDPMGLESWYGEEQASQVQRDVPLDFIGFIPSPGGKIKTLAAKYHGIEFCSLI